jgi:hypothetical protein
LFTQAIACPKCGKLTAVNFLDKKGTTSAPCVHCRTKISVSTNRDGEVVDITDDSGCYIATACMLSRGMDANCQELREIRLFRDTYVAVLPNGQALLDLYYATAPLAVAAINAHPQARTIYAEIHDRFIQPALDHIRQNRPEEALKLFDEANPWLARMLGQDGYSGTQEPPTPRKSRPI